jgi:catechol 2,3-dioxygenase-like lactoylglutathione lyase family enzyme
MTSDLIALCFDANEPQRLAHFWSGVLGRQIADSPESSDRTDGHSDGSIVLIPNDDNGFRIRFLPTSAPKVELNHLHFELTSSSFEDQQQTVARALELGGQHFDVGQLPEERHVVLADPEGNEFCVIEPGNNFLADCGFLGALSGDGSAQVGHFWSEALGWPLVWDQDEETAMQSPRGGPKITWGGPPYRPKHGKDRLHFDIAPTPGSDQHAEVERLISLGATRLDDGQTHTGRVQLTDPDGREFCVVTTGVA